MSFTPAGRQQTESNRPSLLIRPYTALDQDAVISLWNDCNLTRPWNDPQSDIARKTTTQPELFLVGLRKAQLVATVMAGFDGHRGWIYYLGVSPAYRKRGYGLMMMRAAEQALLALGCPKINLLVRAENRPAIAFYEANGYQVDKVVSLGKRLIADN